MSTTKKLKGFDKERFIEDVKTNVRKLYRTDLQYASQEQIFQAVADVIEDTIINQWMDSCKRFGEQKNKIVYYLSMEFLIGRALGNNLLNLGEYEDVKEALDELGLDINAIEDQEPDPALGNGGLGRLAACFMDSLATGGYHAYGCGIRYHYGMFRQKIENGYQKEVPDNWLKNGYPFELKRPEHAKEVRFGGNTRIEYDPATGRNRFIYENYSSVRAVPYDIPVVGYKNGVVDALRIWDAEAINRFELASFDRGEYEKAVEQDNLARTITEVLYPNDNHMAGKELRLKQQYFMVSASCQNIIRDHLRLHGTLDNFPEKVAIHINDTHPALCVPELMRLFMDEHGMEWDKAWDLVTRTVTYTNHTVLAEALEKWNQQLVRMLMPRIYAIIREIDRRFREDMEKLFPGDTGKINYMAPLGEDQVRMANLSVIGSHRVNGVSALHSEILKDDLFHDFYLAWPDKFTNVTNGIAYRRWLCQSNPKLASLLDETIGPDYRKDARKLEEFAKFASDSSVRKRVEEIKRKNKAAFSDRLKAETGICPDPDSLFITQAKRLHEYKRQLLNALRIISRYNMLRENPNLDMRPETYLFAAKSAPNYYLAKNIIQLICRIGEEIEKDPKIRQKMRVIFLENYSVSMAERLMPASDISEQISLAGKEASGTGNMKLMINGAITIGTLDGANVEMREAVGDDAIFIFGQKADEVQKNLAAGYRSLDIYESNPAVKAAVDRLGEGFAGTDFHKLKDYLLRPTYSIADPYMCLKDFDDYCRVHQEIQDAYEDRDRWNSMSIRNIAMAARFAADRSIRDYAREIWHTKPISE